MVYIILILFLILFLYIFLKLYFEKFDNAFGFTGGLGSGKTLRAVKICLRLLRRNRFKRNWLNFKVFLYNIFHKYKKEYIKDIPLLYSSIPVFVKQKKHYFKNCNVVELKEDYYKEFNLEKYILYSDFIKLDIPKRYVKRYIESSVELTAEHILLQSKINLMSVTFIDEIGGFCSQFEYANPNVLFGLDEFVRLYRHYTKGGYFVVTDQCSDNIVKAVRVRLNKVFVLENFKKYWFLYSVNIRSMSVSEDIKVVELNNKEENEKRTWGLLPFGKIYDTYCYSERYNGVPKKTDNIYTCLKRYDIFKIPKILLKPKTINNKGEIK